MTKGDIMDINNKMNNICMKIAEVQKALTFSQKPVTDVKNGNISQLLIINDNSDTIYV